MDKNNRARDDDNNFFPALYINENEVKGVNIYSMWMKGYYD